MVSEDRVSELETKVKNLDTRYCISRRTARMAHSNTISRRTHMHARMAHHIT